MTDKKIIIEQNTGEPFRILNIEYKKAFKQNQEVIDAMVIATSLNNKKLKICEFKVCKK